MTPESSNGDAARLSAFWDGLIDVDHAPDPGQDLPDLAGTVRRLQALDEVPAADSALIAQTWRSLIDAPRPATSGVGAIAQPGLNGHHPVRNQGTATGIGRTSDSAAMRWPWLAGLYRLVAVGVLGGMLAGLVAGLASRLAMRIAGFLTIEANRGVLTENDAVVGQLTLGGTIFLMFVGAGAGIVGGLLYIALRSWLPWAGWRRSLVFGGLLLGVFGFVVMDPDNPDYHRFGPDWLNVGTFSVIYVIFGLAVGTVVDWLDRTLPPATRPGRPRWRTAVGQLLAAPFVVLGAGAIGLVGMGPLGVPGLVMPLLIAAALVARRWRRWPTVRGWSLAPSLAGYAIVGFPGVVGMALTLRAVTAILTGG